MGSLLFPDCSPGLGANHSNSKWLVPPKRDKIITKRLSAHLKKNGIKHQFLGEVLWSSPSEDSQKFQVPPLQRTVARTVPRKQTTLVSPSPPYRSRVTLNTRNEHT